MSAVRRLVCLALAAVVFSIPCSSASGNHSVTDLLSIGPDGGNANVPATYQGASEDGTHVFFRTDESLVSADTDFSFDIYQRFGTTTTLMSIGSQPGVDLDISSGSLFLKTARASSSALATSSYPRTRTLALDIYERSGGVTTLFPSTSSAAVATPVLSITSCISKAHSQNGSRIMFTTAQQLAPEDTDNFRRRLRELGRWKLQLISTDQMGTLRSHPPSGARPDDGVESSSNERAASEPRHRQYQDVYESSEHNCRGYRLGQMVGTGAIRCSTSMGTSAGRASCLF